MSVTIYNVEAGKDRATIALSGETKVVFSFDPNIIAVEAVSGEVNVSLDEGATAGDDGCDTLSDGQSTRMNPIADKCIYVNGTGTVKVWGGRSGEDCPFKSGAKGGGSGGGCNYKGTTTTAIENGSTTNPITIDGEEYTAVFGDIVVYGYTEFVFDGTTWSEFGRPFDTTPTSRSANAVTSDGIYQFTNPYRTWKNGTGSSSAMGGWDLAHAQASGTGSMSFGNGNVALGHFSQALGNRTRATQISMLACGSDNSPRTDDLFEIGNGNINNRSNIVEVNSTELNVNGEIKKNGVPLPTPYTTMPTITANMVGQIAIYVGETTNDYVKGYFYIASSDGAAEPTYSWVSMVDDTPTSGSKNFVASDGIYKVTPLKRGSGSSSVTGGTNTTAQGNNSFAFGQNCVTRGTASTALGHNVLAQSSYGTNVGAYNIGRNNTLFEIGNGTGATRSNILEADSTSVNINGDIQKNGVSLPTPYTTMPTITADMLGQIAMYVGETTNDYVKGYFYIASSDGAAEPTYSWVSMVDSTPTSGSKNFVTSGAVYSKTPMRRGTGLNSAFGYDNTSSAVGSYSFSFGRYALAQKAYSVAIGDLITSNSEGLFAIGKCNSSKNGDLFEIGNGSSGSNRSNILEVNYNSLNVNGNIQRGGIGIDDYTTTERKIGKWIDGSDLYQRTFEVTGLVNRQWNNNVLGTSGINIVDVQGWIDWTYNSEPNRRLELNYYFNSDDRCSLQNNYTDLNIYPYRTESGLGIDKAIITIKYTKPSAQANLMQTAPTEEVSETPTEEEDDMR